MVSEPSGLKRRNALKIAGASALSTGLAGCSSLLGGDKKGESSVKEADIPDEPVEIGAQTFLEGGGYILGQDNEMGFELAVEHINEAGGIAGRQVNLELVEEQQGAIQNYERFVSKGKDVTFGTLSSGNASSLAPVVEDNQLINISQDGATYTLYEEVDTDPEYFFRMSPPDAGEAVVMARDAVDELGTENINKVASINQNYAWGQSQHKVFSTAIKKLTGAEMAYTGWPEFGSSDFSTHIEAVNNEEPDVLMTSMWGSDLLLFMRQAAANDMFENVDLVVGSIGTCILSEVSKEEFSGWGNTIMGGRILGDLNNPSHEVFPPKEKIQNEIAEKYGENKLPVSGFFASAYASVWWYATAAQQAVRTLGRWPETDEMTGFLANHGHWTPAGFHTSDYRLQNGRQNYSNLYSGKVRWNDDTGRPDLFKINEYPAHYVTAPPGRKTIEWIESW